MLSSGHILIVDDEASLRETLEMTFAREHYTTVVADSPAAALAVLERESVDLVLTDMRMPGGSGFDVLTAAKQVDANIEVIVMTAFASTEDAVRAMRAGAYDYITKPFHLDELMVLVQRALERRALESENVRLRESLRTATPALVELPSKVMRELAAFVERLSTIDATVLIQGESGTGKEVIARAIHDRGARRDGPFIAVNCGALPESLVEAELFGYERGAFTGADRARAGLIEDADGGTLFLDEIGELTLPAQVKLLRVLQERSVRRLGAQRERKLNVRFIAATNRDLAELVAEGRFREDLYYRLNVMPIVVPPLRERREDIEPLMRHFLRRAAIRLGVRELKIEPATVELLQRYAFPGNVRELENLCERAVILAQGSTIGPSAFPLVHQSEPSEVAAHMPTTLPEGFSIDAYLEAIERELYERALKQAGGIKTQAAALLGLSFRQFRYKAKKFGL